MANGYTEKLLVLLHGDLDLKIAEARNLPNMDRLSEHLRQCFTACGTLPTPRDDASEGGGDIESDRAIKKRHKVITSDPYVSVGVPGSTIVRTRVIGNSQNPIWDERFFIPMAYRVEHLEFHLKDNDLFGADLIGTVRVSAERIRSGEPISEWFPVIGRNGKPPKRGTALRLEMKFASFDQNPLYRHSIASSPKQVGVERSHFPLRRGGSVTLYQDAHVPGGLLPRIALDGGEAFTHENCWEDICHAISEAHHLVYIVGWSVFHKVKLIREPTRPLPRGGDLTLGDLLKYKSQEGVRVLLLVWDDNTSHSKFFIHTEGVMQTHDEETRKFFKHSSVFCVLSPRYGSSKLSYIKQKVVGTLFTHHQKCVLVDTQAHGNNRKITAFLGGIDLCDGRYDTPEHRIFRDLDTVFKDDFHNPTFSTGTKAPRQPWHDLHCRIDGPAAYDVLINFEQRWRKATKWSELGIRWNRVSHWHDALLKIERISWILSPELSLSTDGSCRLVPEDDRRLWVSTNENPQTWHVQIFRSIDSGSVKGFPKMSDLARTQNLVCSKNLVIDQSIQTAYVRAIRSAQRFIYIENQYFIGSSHEWPSYENAGADNLVPIELALKIASKIRSNERFAVYVIIPMWPEGDPKSASVQEILFWQNQTMQMMYGIIAKEIRSARVDAHPRDYLNFYCLGKREDGGGGVAGGDNGCQRYGRFMIYVHAKGMIVDDEYVIIGSANINQRSLAGTKDTEIAMGAYQPHQTHSSFRGRPSGRVYGYRMSLWAEHLGGVVEWADEPERAECVGEVNKIAVDNWKRYTGEEFSLLQGHLLMYPVQVEGDGTVMSLEGYESFPDVGGKVVGSPSPTLPDTLTT